MFSSSFEIFFTIYFAHWWHIWVWVINPRIEPQGHWAQISPAWSLDRGSDPITCLCARITPNSQHSGTGFTLIPCLIQHCCHCYTARNSRLHGQASTDPLYSYTHTLTLTWSVLLWLDLDSKNVLFVNTLCSWIESPTHTHPCPWHMHVLVLKKRRRG